MFKRKRYLIGGVLVALALGAIIYNAFGSYSLYYYTVGELKAAGESVYGQQVRVDGQVAEDSIDWDVENRILTFTMTDIDGEESLPVVYEGLRPSAFEDGIEVVAEGSYSSSGTFEANQIITKCPSRYEPTD